MAILQRGWQVLQQAMLATSLLFSISMVNSAPATTGNVVIEIPDGQIQNSIPTQSAPSLFKATDIAGREIIYVGSVRLNTLGSSTTELLGTAKLITTTNAAGSTITGVAEVTTASQSAITVLIPESVISSLSSTPSIFAFTSVDANGQPIINLGQTFVRSNGSTSTAVLENGISTSYLTKVDSQGSTIVETVGLFTRSNGIVITNALSFAGKSFSLTQSKTTASPSYRAVPTTTGSQPSIETLSSKDTGPTTEATARASFSSNKNTARNTSSNSAGSQASSLENVQSASLASFQQRSSSQRFATSRTPMFSANSTSLPSSSHLSVASAGIPKLLDNGFSSTHASSESTLTTSTTSNARPTPDANYTMPISGKAASISESTTASNTRGAAVQAVINAAVNTSISMTAKPTSLPSATARGNSTMSLSSASVGGLLLAVQSDRAILSDLTALLGEQMATITTAPPGMSIHTVTSTTCSTPFAMATTTAAGDTVTQIVPELCHNGAAFFLFGWTKVTHPGIRLNLFGFLLQLIPDPRTGKPVGVEIISAPPGSSEDSTGNPQDDPEHEDDKPSGTQDSSDRASSTSSPYSATSESSTSLVSSMRTISGTSRSSASLAFSTRTISGTSRSSASLAFSTRTISGTSRSSASLAFSTRTTSSTSRSSASLVSSTRTISATTFTSSACSGATTVSGTSKICCDNSTVIGTTTLCNYQIDSWIENLGPFVTTSIPIPASATPVLMPGTSIVVNSATLDAFFSSLASEMVAYAANLTVTTSAVSRSRKTSAPIASATAAVLSVGSGLLGVLEGGISAGEAEQALSTTSATPTSIPTANNSLVGLISSAIGAGETTSTTLTFGCAQYFLLPEDGPNSFVCQCNDDTWNHLKQDTYSLCPSQVTTVSMTIAYPSTTIAPSVSCTLVNFAPSSLGYVPLCECANDLFFADACPTSIPAATTTLTFSEPPATVTAALTKGDFITPTTPLSNPPPSPTTSACVPQCTKHVKLSGPQDSQLEVMCYCNPACGGNAHPKPDANNVCPYQVAVES